MHANVFTRRVKKAWPIHHIRLHDKYIFSLTWNWFVFLMFAKEKFVDWSNRYRSHSLLLFSIHAYYLVPELIRSIYLWVQVQVIRRFPVDTNFPQGIECYLFKVCLKFDTDAVVFKMGGHIFHLYLQTVQLRSSSLNERSDSNLGEEII